MNRINPKQVLKDYPRFKASGIAGKRVIYDQIKPLIDLLPEEMFTVETLGVSTLKTPIKLLKFGQGERRILIWTQMHGNESTGTKALFDVLNYIIDLKDTDINVKNLLNNCTIWVIPMLNPDGARMFTRVNNQQVDLNRDVIAQKGTESVLLMKVLQDFNPHFCFNLHDQRTIFNVKDSDKPATISFLAPSEDIERTITKGRKETMSVIVAMNNCLQQVIPGQIGLYTDAFYPTATGDNFQKMGHNTILIEAGHYINDYDREETRKFNAIALLEGLFTIAIEEKFNNYEPYFDIPQNDTLFFDIIYKNASYTLNGTTIITDVAVQLHYKVENDVLICFRKVEKTGDLTGYFAHKWIDSKRTSFIL